MKNILLILNGTLTPPHVIDAAIHIAKSNSSLLHTVFVHYQSDLEGYKYLFPNDLSLTRNRLTGRTVAEEDAELMEAQMRVFKDECESANVEFFIEPKTNITARDIIQLSVFSDLILADAHQDIHEHHIADLLADAACPVYLISKDGAATQHVVLAYDGSISSVHSMKMYSYLFPSLKDLHTTLLFVNHGNHNELPQEKNIRMWLVRHFTNLDIKILQGNVSEALVQFTRDLPHSLAVMGSYSGNHLTRMFHKSHANAIIEEGRSSVFITHK